MANVEPHLQTTASELQASVSPMSEPEQRKCVPESFALREQIAEAAKRWAEGLPKSHPPTQREIRSSAERLLDELQRTDAYLGWAMVAVASAFWRDQVAAIPYDRRLLLLPRCLRDEQQCPAECDELGLLCRDCGACPLSEFRAEARRYVYQVLIAEGSPAVIKLILAGKADAIVGVACLDSLEKMFDKLVRSGIPAMAVPLLRNGCRRTTVDASAVHRLIAVPYRPGRQHTASYLPLTRCAARLFEPEQLYRVAPPLRKDRWPAATDLVAETVDPIACTESLAYDYLIAGGKYSRPFITLAVYDALNGSGAVSASGSAESDSATIPEAVQAVALATEAFHKASLVHDDVEDDDAFRYGKPALHRRFGAATAINVGDYLIGLGYRLVAAQHGRLTSDVIADLIAQFAMAHTRLCEGQGAELIWRDGQNKAIQPLDALKIYALKTAPAFEAALLAGARLAGPVDAMREPLARYARQLGVAYQIVNDLADWTGDTANKVDRATDLLTGRPTILWALALERLPETGRRELQSIVTGSFRQADAVTRVSELYHDAQVFERARALLEKHHARAIETAAQLPHPALRRLLHFLADAIVDRKRLVAG